MIGLPSWGDLKLLNESFLTAFRCTSYPLSRVKKPSALEGLIMPLALPFGALTAQICLRYFVDLFETHQR